jgi:UDP-N-acetylglucosamine 2-epimerase (non-hydrolysing)
MITFVYGTRPEYIKMLPLIKALPKESIRIISTHQHTSLVESFEYDQLLPKIPEHHNRLNSIMANTINFIDFKNSNYVLVQGDTTSAVGAAIAAFNSKIPVIHLEAGLRSFDNENPYPEEMNRKLISQLASIHLCPTYSNRTNLFKEGIIDSIYVTGNTGLDLIDTTPVKEENKVIITIHRRENQNVIINWIKSFNQIAEEFKDIQFHLYKHPSMIIENIKASNILIKEPIQHNQMIKEIKESKLVLSDSGGIQEETCYLHKKIIILRKCTERPECLTTNGILCMSPNELISIFKSSLSTQLKNYECPFGDGKATQKIIKIIKGL